MKKQNLIIFVVLLVLIAGGLFLFKSKSRPLTKLGNKNATESKNESLVDTLKGTLDQVLAKGQSVKCTFTDTQDGTKVESTTYISGTRFRSETKTTDEGNETMEYNMISDGEWAYVWSNQQETGMKMKYSDFEKPEDRETGPHNPVSNMMNAMKAYNYSCVPWITDPSKFNAPTDIEFQDLSAMMNDLEETTANMTKELCNSCDELDTADQIASCKENMNCSD